MHATWETKLQGLEKALEAVPGPRNLKKKNLGFSQFGAGYACLLTISTSSIRDYNSNELQDRVTSQS